MKVTDFDLEQTLECGQCFNFEKINDHEYVVVAKDRMLHIKQTGNDLEFLNASDSEVKNIWIPYFDLERDYAAIKRKIKKADPRLEPVLKEFYGVRILDQDFTETLISFIISQNKNIPHIKQIIRRISETHGKLLYSPDETSYHTSRKEPVITNKYYSFPGLSELKKISEAEFKELKTGFRAPYLRDAIDKLSSGEINEAELIDSDYSAAKEKLLKIKGVGDKVANCVLLFGLGKRNAFPIDVWIYRIMNEMYRDEIIKTMGLAKDIKDIPKNIMEEFAYGKFGDLGGYAQQYLFIYARSR